MGKGDVRGACTSARRSCAADDCGKLFQFVGGLKWKEKSQLRDLLCLMEKFQQRELLSLMFVRTH